MMAAGCGYAGIVQVLLDKGADPHAETSDGKSARRWVSGVQDIDKFTAGKCQAETVQAVLSQAPGLKLTDNFYGLAARLAANAAGCTDVPAFIDRKQPQVEHSPRRHV